ncbi:MAG: hypothetical protein WCG47_04955 [Dermatophilaceae bacterium]
MRDGPRVLRFTGTTLAKVSSERPGAPRWSEIEVHRLPGRGGYVFAEVGRSTVAHTPDCLLVTHRMPSWLDAREEGKIRRVPCVQCRPVVGDQMDPHTRLEAQRYRAVVASDEVALVAALTGNRPWALLPQLIREVLMQCYDQDADLMRYSEATPEPKDSYTSTRTGK